MLISERERKEKKNQGLMPFKIRGIGIIHDNLMVHNLDFFLK